MTGRTPGVSRKTDLLPAFLMPAALFLVILCHAGVLPFGKLTLLFSDLDSQYVEFMAEYRRVLLGEGSFSWSWHMGMGMNFIALIAYYLASPFNFLLILFPEEQLPLAVSLLITLKIGCAGAAFAVYLRSRFDARGPWLLILSSCYALSSYTVGYSFNIMWLDALIWLPLLCAGTGRLLENGPKAMSALTLILALSFLSQFYMSWMTGIFCALYFLGRVLMLRMPVRDFLKNSIRFGICVGIAAGLSAFLLLPAFFVLKNNMGLLGQAFPGLGSGFSFPDILPKLFIGSFDGIKDCLPHVCCGICGIIGVFLYFLQNRIPLRERLVSGALLVLLLLSFWIAPLDFLWHAMDHPSWFPYRYAFVFCFWTLSLAYEGIRNTASFREFLAGCGCCLLLLAAAVFLKGEDKAKFLLLNLFFPIAYAAAARFPGERAQRSVFLLAACAELLLGGSLILTSNSGGFTPLADYQDFHEHYRGLTRGLLPGDGDFYRMEKRTARNYNDPLGIGFPGISHFSSTASARQAEFLKRLGFNCYATWCTYQGSTQVSDAMLRIRYEFGESGKQDSIPAGKETWEHPAQFPLFFFAEDRFARYNFLSETDAVSRQNDLLLLLDDRDDSPYFDAVPVTVTRLENTEQRKDGVYYRIDPELPAFLEAEVIPVPGKSLYLHLPGASLNNTVTVSGTDKLMDGNRDYAPFPICLDAYTGEGTVKIRIDLLKNTLEDGILAYALDTDRLADLTAAVRAAAPEIIRTSETGFQLKTEADENDRLVVSSMPFDAGWRVSADGRQLPLKMIHESVLGFILPAGSQTAEITYRVYGQEQGLILSGCALLLWIALFFCEKRLIRKTEGQENTGT